MENVKKFNSFNELLNDHDWLTDVLATAIYGSPWFHVSTHADTDDETYKSAKVFSHDCREDIWAYVLQHGGYLLVVDTEDEKEYKISLKDFEDKIVKFVLNCPSQYAAIMDETMDLYDADALLQTVVFGEVIYG
jgi:hypothetical protein